MALQYLPPFGGFAIAVLAGLFGGFVRGYSGFGFSLAAIPVLTIVYVPAEAVTAVLPLEILLGLATVPGQRGHISWVALRWLVLGTLLGTPLGVAVLASAPAGPMRWGIGLVVLVAVAILSRRPELPGLLKPQWLAVSGFVSGCLNGGTALSGPPAIISLLGSPLPARDARATLMAFIAVSATLAAAIAFAQGLFNSASAIATLAMAPAGAIGAATGSSLFGRMPERFYRPASLAILATITAIVLGGLASTIGRL